MTLYNVCLSIVKQCIIMLIGVYITKVHVCIQQKYITLVCMCQPVYVSVYMCITKVHGIVCMHVCLCNSRVQQECKSNTRECASNRKGSNNHQCWCGRLFESPQGKSYATCTDISAAVMVMMMIIQFTNK